MFCRRDRKAVERDKGRGYSYAAFEQLGAWQDLRVLVFNLRQKLQVTAKMELKGRVQSSFQTDVEIRVCK